jgi:hypothetical protein
LQCLFDNRNGIYLFLVTLAGTEEQFDGGLGPIGACVGRCLMVD